MKFMSYKKATFDELFTVDLTLYIKCQIYDEVFFNFCGLLRNHEIYLPYFYHDMDFTAVNYKGMKKGVEKMFSIHTKEK